MLSFFSFTKHILYKKDCLQSKGKIYDPSCYLSIEFKVLFSFFMLIDKCRFVNLTDVHIIN